MEVPDRWAMNAQRPVGNGNPTSQVDKRKPCKEQANEVSCVLPKRQDGWLGGKRPVDSGK